MARRGVSSGRTDNDTSLNKTNNTLGPLTLLTMADRKEDRLEPFLLSPTTTSSLPNSPSMYVLFGFMLLRQKLLFSLSL